MSLWRGKPHFNIGIGDVMFYSPLKGEELYKQQADHLSAYLLIQDYDANIQVDVYPFAASTHFKWPNKGELISGSFMAKTAAEAFGGLVDIQVGDVDIYFKCKADAQEFGMLNHLKDFDFSSKVCTSLNYEQNKLNLIYGVEYESPASLISRFDIRACSIAFDPVHDEIHMVRGSLNDVMQKEIKFNPVPRGVSIRRLLKYTEKGFKIDAYQRLFFAELVRSNIYSTKLELITGY